MGGQCKSPDDELVMERIVFTAPDPVAVAFKCRQWSLQ
jgi:hypothetical protein